MSSDDSDNNNSKNENDSQNDTINVTGTQTTDYLYALFTNPSLLITLSIIVLIFYLLFSSLGNSTNSEVGTSGQEKSSLAFVELLLWATFFLLVFINSAVYFFELDITAGINNLFSEEPQIDINVTTPYSDELSKQDTSDTDNNTSSGPKEEVFHIPGNDYVYEDAKALCGAYNSRLATYNEVEDAYNKGGEWCSYGWSEDQLALYPTQKETYEKLQEIEGHENDCGRPGVNGGYISNKGVRFGVNCFGAKPKITALEREIMNNAEKYPKTLNDLAEEKRTNYWKDHLKNIILSPFNSSTWSKI
tara:strand:+ start:40 stop:951 length:912 start_codon:yes stop_codon:yes gene_type:complete